MSSENAAGNEDAEPTVDRAQDRPVWDVVVVGAGPAGA
ncbi:hypothetical protein, partial [Streptomyces albus]